MEERFLNQAIASWDLQVANLRKLLSKLSDEALQKEVAVGRNTGWYVLGHLVAVSDALSEMIGTGQRQYPDLQAVFIQHPDRSGLPLPSISQLRSYVETIAERLSGEFRTLNTAEWLNRHNAMTDDEFLSNPERNKLSVLLNRTNHLSYHIGQLRLLF